MAEVVEPLPGVVMDEDEARVFAWSQENLGEGPQEVTLWAVDGDRLECLVRLSRSVAVAVLVGDGEEWIDEQRMVVQASEWTPGAIQANRRPDGCTRIRFRRRRVDLSAVLKSPHWVAALLEEWLMSARGEGNKPRDRTRRLAALKREREAVRRMLDQGSLERIRTEVERIAEKLEQTETDLGGRAPAKTDIDADA